jgi:hypothetical protein
LREQRTRKIDVSQSGATSGQYANWSIRDQGGMSQVQVMKMFSKPTDVFHCTICQQTALGQNEIADLGGIRHDTVDGVVCYEATSCQIEHAKLIEWARQNKRGLFVGL